MRETEHSMEQEAVHAADKQLDNVDVQRASGKNNGKPMSSEEFTAAIIALHPELLHMAEHWLRSNPAASDDAEAYVQNTYLKAIKALDSFRGESSLKTWLGTILRNDIFGDYRKNATEKKRLGTRVDEEDESEEGIWERGLASVRDTNTPSGFEEIAKKDLIKIVAGLPETHRVVIEAEMENPEAVSKEKADLLGLKEANYKTRLRRAREALHEVLVLKKVIVPKAYERAKIGARERKAAAASSGE